MKIRSCSSQTHHGPTLKLNEDRIGLDHQKEVYFLLDGMGGAGVGDVFCKHLEERILKTYGMLTQDRNRTLPFFYGEQYELETNAMMNALLQAHDDFYQENLKHGIQQRGAASGAFVVHSERMAHIILIGSAQVFFGHHGLVEELFRPDLSFASHGENAFAMTGHAIGLFGQLNYQIREIRPAAGDFIMLCSDGVYQWVRPESLTSLFRLKDSEIQKSLQDLFTRANHLGNWDNQSAIFLNY